MEKKVYIFAITESANLQSHILASIGRKVQLRFNWENLNFPKTFGVILPTLCVFRVAQGYPNTILRNLSETGFWVLNPVCHKK